MPQFRPGLGAGPAQQTCARRSQISFLAQTRGTFMEPSTPQPHPSYLPNFLPVSLARQLEMLIEVFPLIVYGAKASVFHVSNEMCELVDAARRSTHADCRGPASSWCSTMNTS